MGVRPLADRSSSPRPAKKPVVRASPLDAERPRERLRRLGSEALSDAELLALVLGTGTASEPVEQLSLRVLAQHGGALGLARSGVGVLARELGEARAARLAGAFELARRAASTPLARSSPYASSRDVVRAYAPRFADRADECVVAVVLDVRQRPIAERLLALGGPTGCALAVRDVFALAVREGGAAFLLVHNHPSGDPTPSSDDERLTRALVEAGRWLDVPLLDHVIVSRGGSFSFLDAGLLSVAPASPTASCGPSRLENPRTRTAGLTTQDTP